MIDDYRKLWRWVIRQSFVDACDPQSSGIVRRKAIDYWLTEKYSGHRKSVCELADLPEADCISWIREVAIQCPRMGYAQLNREFPKRSDH